MERIGKLKEFLEANPHDNFVQHALALEYIKMGNDVEARRLFEHILEKDPSYTGSYYHLAKLLERNNEPDAAVAVYEKGIEQSKLMDDQLSLRELRAALEDLTF